MKIGDDRIADVAQAIKDSHYPDHVDSDFKQEAKSFVAAWNACIDERPMVVLKAHGNNGIGAVSLPGALIGMRVANVVNVTVPDKFDDFTESFERVISQADQIQQTAPADMAAAELQFSLRPAVELPDQKTAASTPVGESVLNFKLVPPWIKPGLFVFGAGIAPNTRVTEFVAAGPIAAPGLRNTVNLSSAVVEPGVAIGEVIHFAQTADSPRATDPHAVFFGFGRAPVPIDPNPPPAKEKSTVVPAMPPPVDRPAVHHDEPAL